MVKKPRTNTKELFKTTLSADKEFMRFRRIVKNIMERTDVEALYSECMGLHVGRKSRTLTKGSSAGPGQIADAVLQDNSYRSRFSEVRVQLTRTLGSLETIVDATKKYIAGEYSDYIPEFRAQAERRTYLDQYMRTAIKFQADIKNCIECIDILIKDIDNGHWNIKIAFECLVITHKGNTERNV